MRIGLVGKPNVGKSTFYAAATQAEAEIGNYPFTTIEANRGMAYVRVDDPGPALGVVSRPRSGRVLEGLRRVPVELIDVAGLVPGAHAGKGLGNRFLTDLARADALIHVIDASGSTDAEGNPVRPGQHDAATDAAFLIAEIDQWIDGILADGWDKLTRRVQQENRKLSQALVERLAGIGVSDAHARSALHASGLDGMAPKQITEEARFRLASEIRRRSKPILIALNKADQVAADRIAALREQVDARALPVSAQAELALGKATAAGVITHTPGAGDFRIVAEVNDAQKEGLDFIQEHVLDRFGKTGVHAVLEAAVFDLLGHIPVFPVEDDHHFTDKDGRVLPDCHLVPTGTTAKQLAYRVHTDLGDHFIRGIDCRSRRVIGADHVLEKGDVIRIVADA